MQVCEFFLLPKYEIQGYDKSKVFFGVTEEEANTLYLKRELPPLKALEISQKNGSSVQRLNAVRPRRTFALQITYEKLILERKYVSDYRITDQKPVKARTKIKIPLRKEITARPVPPPQAMNAPTPQ